MKAGVFGFDQGQELSEQTAAKPAMLYFVRGEATVGLGDDMKEAQAGTWVHMPAGLETLDQGQDAGDNAARVAESDEEVLAARGTCMPQTPHVEKHFTASETVRDIVIGMSDGLTVPFALAAGLSGAVDSSGIIVIAGLSEVAAGAIAMGLGGYLAARTDAEHFASERAREERETEEMPEQEAAEVADVLRSYGLEADKVTAVVNSICADKKRWVDFMMRFELGLEEPDPKRARNSALTIALSYIAGGMVPLAPYFFFRSIHTALIGSVVVTLMALWFSGTSKGALQRLDRCVVRGKRSSWVDWRRPLLS